MKFVLSKARVAFSPVVGVLAIACGTAAPPVGEADQIFPTEPQQKQPAAQTEPSTLNQSKAEIDALVAGAGQLNTDKTADLEPQKLAEHPAVEVTDASGKSFVCTQTEYSLTKIPEKFVALNPNADVLWPGSLVQGRSMAKGILDPIPAKRAPGTITLVLASGGKGPFFKKVDAPSLSSAITAQNDILNEFDGVAPAKFSYSYTSVYSADQLAVAVDANVGASSWSAGASLSVNKSDAKSRFLIQFTQEYFTMAFDPPTGPSGVFAPEVTAKELAPYIDNGNPPLYVASVTYGRTFYIMFESSESQQNLEAAVRGSLGSTLSASVSAQWKKVINESTVKAYGLGGNAEVAIGAITGTDQFEKLSKFLSTGANVDKTSPGAPISYSLRNLSDSSQVRLALTTDYTAKNCTPIPYGCDGKKGSNTTVDECGVCGGNGSTCASCPAESLQTWASNGAYVNFNIGSGVHGKSVTFPDGNYYKFSSLQCQSLSWGNVLFTCSAGHWYFSRGSLFEGNSCKGDTNASWSDGTNSISTGYAKH